MIVGIGYDIHRLEKDRKLILGGLYLEYPFGLKGHSDGDVLVHSICDAILGALELGDIGTHFPDTDPLYKDISSLLLLEKVNKKVKEKGYIIKNVDATVICEKPKLTPFFPEMKSNISKILSTKRVSLKAKTNEGLGALGRGEGIAAISVCLLEERRQMR